MHQVLRDRREAGRRLGLELRTSCTLGAHVVLGLEPGGVPVALEVAHKLGAPLDVWLVEPLVLAASGAPRVGVIATGGTFMLDPHALVHAPLLEVQRAVARGARVVEAREAACRGGRPPVEIAGATAVLVSDGLVETSLLCAAVSSLRARRADRVVVAIPCVTEGQREILGALADELRCVAAGAELRRYEDERPLSAAEVRDLLEQAPSTEVHAAQVS